MSEGIRPSPPNTRSSQGFRGSVLGTRNEDRHARVLSHVAGCRRVIHARGLRSLGAFPPGLATAPGTPAGLLPWWHRATCRLQQGGCEEWPHSTSGVSYPKVCVRPCSPRDPGPLGENNKRSSFLASELSSDFLSNESCRYHSWSRFFLCTGG